MVQNMCSKSDDKFPKSAKGIPSGSTFQSAGMWTPQAAVSLMRPIRFLPTPSQVIFPTHNAF